MVAVCCAADAAKMYDVASIVNIINQCRNLLVKVYSICVVLINFVIHTNDMKKYLPYFFRLAVLFSLVFSVNFSGQILFSNPITGTNPSTANPYIAGQVFAANITVSEIARGSGISANTGDDRYNASGWNSPSLEADDYFEFTITPSPNFKINFSDFVYSGQASDSGPKSFAFRSSLDNFTSDIGNSTATGAIIS